MSEFKVRSVEFEEKSAVEVENELIEKHEQDHSEEKEETPVVELKTEDNKIELKDEDVLSYIGSRYGKEINSIDELFEKRTEEPELDADVAAFLKFKKETNRGIDDFVKLNRDLDKEDPKKLIAEYKREVEGLDDDEIAFELSGLEYDEDIDSDEDIKRAKLALKKEEKKAKEYFENQKAQYKVPVEPTKTELPADVREKLETFEKYTQSASSMEEETLKRQQYFAEKADEVLSEKFEGFKFTIDEKEFTFKPGDVESVKSQANVQKFIESFLDENGYVKNAEEFLKRMTIAQNPEKYAQFFYEQGLANGVKDIAKDSKNIDMSARSSTQVQPRTTGFQVREVKDSNERTYKIKASK